MPLVLITVLVALSGAPPARADVSPIAPTPTPSPSPADPAGAPLTTQPAGSLPGIDISHWQDAVDWPEVAASGVRFVIAKATQGDSWNDPMYASYEAGAEAVGIPFTAYHFAEPDTTPHDAVHEADHFVDVAQLGPGNLVPALDVERSGGLSPHELTRWILRWLNEVTARLGVRPMVYTSPNGWKDRTDDTTAIADAGYTVLWVAHWNVSSPTVPALGWAGSGWRFWQYTDCGSVPGIVGCVDRDWHAGTSLGGVTIASPDATPPTATVAPPAYLGSPTVVRFSEPVHDVTPGNVVLWQPDAASPVPSSFGCLGRAGAPVDCMTGAVRTAVIRPLEPLVAGQSYALLLDPAGVTPQVVDGAGNPLAAVQHDFTAATHVEQDAAGVTYAWRSVRNHRAFGNSYATERVRGATYSMAFPGRSVTWYTVAGPTQGRAEVFIDGRSRGVFDQHAPSTAFRVARSFTELGPGWHTLRIEVLGGHAASATDAQVAVDAIGFGGGVVRTPHGATSWRPLELTGTSGGSVAATDTPRASVSFRFQGTGVAWTTVRGPNQGRAAIYVDGAFVRRVDDYADVLTTNVARDVAGLADGVHTLRIVALGTAPPRALDALTTVDAFDVTP